MTRKASAKLVTIISCLLFVGDFHENKKNVSLLSSNSEGLKVNLPVFFIFFCCFVACSVVLETHGQNRQHDATRNLSCCK